MKRKKSFDIEVQWLVGDGTPTKGGKCTEQFILKEIAMLFRFD
jgi:hypothetical protein